MATCTRIEKIRKYLEQHEAEIESAGCGSLSIDYAGADVTIKVSRVDRNVGQTSRDTLVKMD